MKRYSTLAAEHVCGRLAILCQTVQFVVSTAKQKKCSVTFKNCTKDIKYYLPKARLHALHNKQHKKSQFLFLSSSCVLVYLETGLCAYV